VAEARVAEIARRHNVPAGKVHVEEAYAVEDLPRFASNVSADVVVMGGVSRSLPRRMLFGHTAERVLDALDCDVLIAKSPGFRSAVSRQSVHRFPKSGTQRAKYIW
jgi:universal stress protein E